MSELLFTIEYGTKPTLKPSDINLSCGLQSTFGCVEFEEAICHIICFLADDTRNAGIPEWMFGNGEGWGKKLCIDTIPEIEPAMFAMLCASGWLCNVWFPKRAFAVSKDFIQRLHEKQLPATEPMNWRGKSWAGKHPSVPALEVPLASDL